ncbi:hypothetical protein PHMEG_00033227 [Phytophthora megakarya]|uniref:No apical meristem-associated C-terminal domain-containing protein n=1 Tax=Phytophthora megakarya TaxID=4795 RepID=A0A225UU04_9STRA|nr:hypothetical protein PHMEG_00033227 [Phytophthora megakarya]
MTMAEIDMTENPRVASSLQTRWRSLQATCNKFAGCYAAIFARNESGKSIEDKIIDAHALYREQNGSAFKSQAVWQVLRYSPKWFESLTSKKGSRKRKEALSGATVATIADQTELERPVGKKMAKKSLDTEASLAALVKKLAHETERKNKLLEDATNEQIMARRLDGMSAMQQRYYKLKQAQILSELEKEFDASS